MRGRFGRLGAARSPSARSTDPAPTANLAGSVARRGQPPNRIRVDRRLPALVDAPRFRLRDAVHLPLAARVGFDLGDDPGQVEDRLARREDRSRRGAFPDSPGR
jgi:hypothetical protein